MTGQTLDLFTAKERGRTGMQRSLDRAERAEPDWGAQALEALRRYARVQTAPFTIEQARAAIVIAEPTDGRAWGGVTQTAIRLDYIRRIPGRFAPASSSNGSPKQLYSRGLA